jgi:hypothetical protein
MKTMAKRCLPLVLLACWLGLAPAARAQEEDGDSVHNSERFEVGFDFLWSWMKGDFFPAMATMGNVNDSVPGALGQPNTQIILGNDRIDHGQVYGGRINLAYWLNEARTLSIEGNFFLMEQQTFVFNTAGSGASDTEVLAKPFYNPVEAKEDADPRAFPGVLAGNVNFNYMTRLMGAEVNGRWVVAGDYFSDGPSLSILAGVRWLNLQERYTSAETTTELPVGTGSTFFISDNFSTLNQYVGGQLGVAFRYRLDCNLTFDIAGKCAVGPNFEMLRISGFSTVTDQFGNVFSGNEGLYAQPSNSGQRRHSVIAVMPEGSLGFGWEPFSWLKLQVGYSFMYLTKVIRPGETIDRVVNIQPVGATEQFGPADPVARFNQVGFWVHFVNFGVGFTF